MPSVSIKKAAMINAAAKYSSVVMSLIFTAVLARVLTPQDYGIVAVVFVFTAFFKILCDMGLSTAVIQNKELSERDIASIFGFSVYLAIFLAVAFCLLSIPISIIYDNKVYVRICCILSVAIIFGTLNMVPNALLMKDKRFVSMGVRIVLINFSAGVLTIIMALLGAKYYALVIQSVIVATATFIWNYISTRPKLKLKYEKQSIDKVKSYGGFQFAFNIFNYFARNLDNLLIGKFIGTSQLAFYNQAYNLMIFPLNNFTYIVSSVMHPILSEYQNNKQYIYDQYLKVAKILSLIGVFITAFCVSSSKEIVLIIFGSQWFSTISCFKLLAISIFFQMTVSGASPVYQSLGNTKTMFKSGAICSAVMVTCIILGVRTGDIDKIAMLVTISLILRFFIDYYFLMTEGFGYSALKFYKVFIPDIVILLLLHIAMFFSGTLMIDNLFISALYKFGVCISVYAFLLIISKQYKYLLPILPFKLRSKFQNK